MKTTVLFSIILGIVITASLIGACKKSDSTTPTAKPTLYDSLGGTTMVADPANAGQTIEKGRLLIRNIIDSTIFVIAADDSINGHFVTLLSEVGMGNLTGFEALSKNLTDFVAVGTGAKNYTYGGRSMVTAHDPAQNSRMTAKVTTDGFSEFEIDLVAGAGKAGVAANTPALGSVAKIVESLRSQVVQQ